MPSDKTCCVPGCLEMSTSRRVLHCFPNPTKDLKRFNTWISNICAPELAGLTNEYIFKYRRVCHAHFEQKYWCRYERISKIAIPTLNIRDKYNPEIDLKSGEASSFSSCSSVKKKAEIVTESDLLYGDELSDDDGLNQPATNAATGDDTQPATPSMEIVANDTTTIIFPLTDKFLTQTNVTPVPVSSIVTEIVTDPVPANYLMPCEVRPPLTLHKMNTKTAAQFFMEFSGSPQISHQSGHKFGGSSDVSSAPEMEHDYCVNVRRKRRHFKAYGAEMVAYYHKQWSLMRKKLHHQSLQLRRLRKRVETLEGRSREGAGKT